MDSLAVQSFWERVDRNGPIMREGIGPCWLWRGRPDRDGYGRVGVAALRRSCGTTLAHRVSWMVEHGWIPSDVLVCHECDNPPCVRASHLFRGTNADNLGDMVRKGRSCRGERHARVRRRDEMVEVYPWGMAHPASKLTDGQVIEIRRMVDAGGTKKRIAKEFGVSDTMVRLIGRRTSWRHLPETGK